MMTLNGMFSEPKPHRINFIKENKKKLKHIPSQITQNIKYPKDDMAKSQSSQTDVGRLVQSSSRINTKTSSHNKLNKKSTITVFMRERKKDETESSTALVPSKKSTLRSVTATKNQATQTIDPKNYDQLFHEGTILYPSSRVIEEIAEAEKQKANRLDAHVKKEFFKKNRIKSRSPPKSVTKCNSSEKKKENEEPARSEEEENKAPENLSPVKGKESDTKFIVKPRAREPSPKLIAAEIIRKTAEDHLHYSPRGSQVMRPLPAAHGDSGSSFHIPKVMRKNYKKIKKEDSEVLKTVLDPLCPPGHIPLPDQERKKTLHMLRVTYAELIREMNVLPVRTDTLRIRQRKIQLENQLNKIEEGIKVFNKSKVYVKIEE